MRGSMRVSQAAHGVGDTPIVSGVAHFAQGITPNCSPFGSLRADPLRVCTGYRHSVAGARALRKNGLSLASAALTLLARRKAGLACTWQLKLSRNTELQLVALAMRLDGAHGWALYSLSCRREAARNRV